MTAGLPLIKSVPLHLAKNVLLPLGVMAASSATYPAIQKNVCGCCTTTLLFSNDRSCIKC